MKHLETVRAALAEDCKTLVTDRMAIIDGLQRDYHSGAYLAKEGLKNPPQSNKDAKRPSTASSSSRRKRAHRAEPQQTQDEDEEEAGTDTTSGGARQSKSRDNSKRGKSRQAARRAQENLSVDNDDIDAVIYQEEQTDTKKRGAQDAEEEEGDKYCIEGCTGTGEMVGCDNPDCPGQWFHYTCVGLTGPPDTKKWYVSQIPSSKPKGQKDGD
ncbi:uncharacterized protein MONBRDRAFT_27377 [Monosiga brevicollis MX1]|uniref:Zinc finger PHD-type domain-containing protein n=1 Tax=Monosiga brevicollis TaxID=81824 RepID=A9V540_MONBE|nr:uncharacterized protein MONBRDRAFT_27377 [Monosiga brevicollis MX1]EDQ87314.1 predicted protein [Monosiga brevicollis MX1]|eukprot:XP_001747927.1 hypothetical protein [Monosiga brevicollis MX1]